jgi:hypothetical protein
MIIPFLRYLLCSCRYIRLSNLLSSPKTICSITQLLPNYLPTLLLMTITVCQLKLLDIRLEELDRFLRVHMSDIMECCR